MTTITKFSFSIFEMFAKTWPIDFQFPILKCIEERNLLTVGRPTVSTAVSHCFSKVKKKRNFQRLLHAFSVPFGDFPLLISRVKK